MGHPSFPTADQHNIFQAPSNCDNALHHRLAPRLPASRKRETPSFPTADQHNIFKPPSNCDNALHHRLAPRLPASRKMGNSHNIFQAPSNCDNALHHRLAPRLPASRKRKLRPFRRLISPFELRQRAPSPSSPHGFLRLGKRETPSFPTADQHNIFNPLKLRPHAPPPSSLRLSASRKMGVRPFRRLIRLAQYFQAPPKCDNAFLHRLAPRLPASRKRKLRPFRRLISTIFSTPFKLRPHAPPPSSLRLPASRKMGTRPFRRLIRLHNIFNPLKLRPHAPPPSSLRLSASRKMGVRPFRRLISTIFFKPLRSATTRFFIVWPHGFLRLGRGKLRPFRRLIRLAQYFQAPTKCDNAFLHRLAPRLPASRKMGVRPFRRLIRWHNIFKPLRSATTRFFIVWPHGFLPQYFQAPTKCDNALHHRLAPRLSASRKMGVRPFRRLIRWHNIFKPLRSATTRFFIVWPHGFLRLGRWETPSFPTADQHNIFQAPSNCDNALHHRLAPRLPASRKMGTRPFRRLIRWHNIFKPLRSATTRFFIVWPHGFLRLGRGNSHNIFKPPSNCDNALHHRLAPRLPASRKMGTRPFRRLIRWHNIFQAPTKCDNAFLHRLAPRLPASRKMGVRPFRRLIRWHNIFKPLRTATTRSITV
ncbi:unnamed protein product [Caenorhabditis auriculariae]|uniref:Uncharacterized protein n=1 Tax=Caenorhabditis auriculariae TaxID=2777116 RepID=A0A8S1H6W2_9PELO|nr:unnamed protein product [Caenorhabditis auriculariae]